MAIELKVPSAGESITEVQIGQWLKGEGQFARAQESLVEIETDKATMELPAPVSGVVTKVLKQQGQRATVGEVIGYFEERAAADTSPTTPGQRDSSVAGTRQHAQAATTNHSAQANVGTKPLGSSAAQAGAKPEPRIMPAAARALDEHGLTTDQVDATGPGGRLLKEDVERAAVRGPAPSATPTPLTVAPAATHIVPGSRNDRVRPMSLIRQRIAERLVAAQQNSALLTTFNEIDMSAVIVLRKEHGEAFRERYGVKLGFMSFFIKAAVEALGQFPEINAEIRGQDIVYHDYCDIGVAVGGGRGLVVPVLRNAELMKFSDLEIAIADFARRAADNKLELSELQGGTFTISNGGVYGSLLSTPIVNPPQSGILGLHAIQERPVARQGQVVIRPMMYVALTYDHRLVDGREAVTFLRRIKELIEDPARLLLDV
ncbi:MAG: 2-oxoglutarate dehydrogenase complex dihydrolipoyllysine-residue succinyltransferase [Pirellulales bacterium]|nr:2-oxoglutarate dehydrogenase complex dihydrolipoyllysine-residue succinyltransferase [Pirellulales bacterium]